MNSQILLKMNGILVQAINAMHDTLNDAVKQQQDFNNINNININNNNNVLDSSNNTTTSDDHNINNQDDHNNHDHAINNKNKNNNKKKTGPKYDSPWICFVKHRSANIKLDKGQKLMTVLANEWNDMDPQHKQPFVEQANFKKISNHNLE
ncbi:MAG: hypothetical protein EBU93_03230 [Chlamydiae bacterium]|nr:hypothetical protein [Chlamydiota bacterium]